MRRYRSHLFILSSNNTYMSVPFLSLGSSSTVTLNPLPGTSSHCKIDRSSWPNKTQILEKKYEAISNHAYKRSKKTQITVMDKNIDLILNSSSSDPNKHTAKRLTSYGSPRDHGIDNQERERGRGSHLATNYRPVGLQRTTHESSERHQWTR